MAEKLTPAKIEEAAKHYENISSGKTPIIEKDKGLLKETTVKDLHEHLKKKDPTTYPLIPPTDPRLLMKIAPFTDDMLKEFKIQDRKELSKKMYDSMTKYGGIGLSANQVGLPFRMFVAGGHPELERGMAIAMYNPVIKSISDDTTMLKEGCLSFPFIFLAIKRPKDVVMSYTDTNGKEQEAHLKGLMARVCLHEYDHMQGKVFTEHASKMKLDMAKKKATKMMRMVEKRKQPTEIGDIDAK